MPDKSDKMTSKERLGASLLGWAPWLSFFAIALPAPIIFLLLYLASTTIDGSVFYIFMTLMSLLFGSIAGLIVAIFFFVYRKRWMKRLRERLAADGITADELDWFMSELTTSERQALKSIEVQNALLADAYRETLAARLTATRVVASAKRDLLTVERRLNRVAYLQGTDTMSLQEELRADRERLERVRNEGLERRAETEARLQMIEAAASRGASFTETEFALKRLDAVRDQPPLALESIRQEQQAREEVAREMREEEQRKALQSLNADDAAQ